MSLLLGLAALVACADDTCGRDTTRSEVTFPVRAGATYLIRIGGVGFERGIGFLEIDCAP